MIRILSIGSFLFLFIAMQLGSSATYVGFGFAAIVALYAVFSSQNIRTEVWELIRRNRAPWVALSIFLVIAIVVMLAQGVTTPRSWGELKWVFFFLAFVVTAIASLEFRLPFLNVTNRWTLGILIGLTSFSCFAAVYQFATAEDPFREILFGKSGWANRGHGLLRNPVPFAKLMASLALISTSGFLVALVLRNRKWLLVCAGLTIACGMALLASQSRGAWLAMAVVGLVGVFAIPARFRRAWAVGLAVISVGGILAFLTIPALNARVQTFVTDGPEKANQTRLEQWHINWMILKENPLGVGFDGNDLREDEWYEKLGYVKRVAGHCHNEFIEIAVATGWPGIIAYGVLTAFMLWLPFVALRRIDVEREPLLAFFLTSSLLVQLFLNGAVMTDQMDTQSRMTMSVAWAFALVGWYCVQRQGGGKKAEGFTDEGSSFGTSSRS